jgi:hypothetical protein
LLVFFRPIHKSEISTSSALKIFSITANVEGLGEGFISEDVCQLTGHWPLMEKFMLELPDSVDFILGLTQTMGRFVLQETL